MLGMRYLARLDNGKPGWINCGQLTIPMATRGNRDVSIPLLPIWPGFAINTVFYAGIVWLLFAGPFVLRRWRRIRRGLCPKCAYDLRGTPRGAATACPECGTPS